MIIHKVKLAVQSYKAILIYNEQMWNVKYEICYILPLGLDTYYLAQNSYV